MMTTEDESLSESTLDQVRRLVKSDVVLQDQIKHGALQAYEKLVEAYPVTDAARNYHAAIASPVAFEAAGAPFALLPLHPRQLWRGVHIITVDDGFAERNHTLACYVPDRDEWTVKEPGLEAELSKKIVGKSRLYYYPDGDSKTRIHIDANPYGATRRHAHDC